ncbi:MAG: hypothetical protein Q7V05_06170 [Methanoregula sp.]|nr:hypothetical protein [Methanoregula sp.]
MQLNNKEIVKRIDVGLRRYSDLKVSDNYSFRFNLSLNEYLELHSLLSDLIDRYAPHDSSYHANLLVIFKNRKLDDIDQLWQDVRLLSGILRGLRLAYAENLLQSVEELIHGAVFQDFLEMAEYFLLQGDQYKHPAAFLIGGVLEEHLRKVAIKNEILTVKDNGQFRHAEDLNMDIRKKDIYSDNERKSITAWLGLRNDVDHAHWEKYSQEKVEVMLKDVRRIINQYPA